MQSTETETGAGLSVETDEKAASAVPGGPAVAGKPSGSMLRGRLIPAFALTLVVLMLALLGWSVFGAHQETVSQNGRIDAPGVFVPIKNRTAPTFQLSDFDGRPVSLSDYRGRVIFVNFWASWCDACKDEAPLLSRIGASLDPSQAVIIGVDALDQQPAGRAFAQQYGLTYPSGFDASGSVAVDYGISGLPETFVVSPSGKLVGKFYGAITSPDQVTQAIKQAQGS